MNISNNYFKLNIAPIKLRKIQIPVRKEISVLKIYSFKHFENNQLTVGKVLINSQKTKKKRIQISENQ